MSNYSTYLKSFFRVERQPIPLPGEGGLFSLGQQAFTAGRQLEEDVFIICGQIAILSDIKFTYGYSDVIGILQATYEELFDKTSKEKSTFQPLSLSADCKSCETVVCDSRGHKFTIKINT